MSRIQFISRVSNRAGSNNVDLWNTTTINRLLNGKPYKKFPEDYKGIAKEKLTEMLELLKYGNKLFKKVVKDDDVNALLELEPLLNAFDVIQYGGTKLSRSREAERSKLLREEETRFFTERRNLESKFATKRAEIDALPGDNKQSVLSQDDYHTLSKKLHSDVAGGSGDAQAIVNSLYNRKDASRRKLAEEKRVVYRKINEANRAIIKTINDRYTGSIIGAYTDAVATVRQHMQAQEK